MTFQTERKGGLSRPAGALAIDAQGSEAEVACEPTQHGKLEVNTLRLGSAMRGGNRFPDLGKGNFPGLVSKLRHSCNTFR